MGSRPYGRPLMLFVQTMEKTRAALYNPVLFLRPDAALSKPSRKTIGDKKIVVIIIVQVNLDMTDHCTTDLRTICLVPV